MNSEWLEATKKEAFLIRKEKLWDVILIIFAVVCILPMSILGIIQTYQVIMPYAGTIWDELTFYVTAIILLAVAVAALYVLCTKVRDCIRSKGGILKSEQTVNRTWKESDGKVETEYYSFSYTDPVSGETKVHKAVNIPKDEHVEVGDVIVAYGQQRGDSLAILQSMAETTKLKLDSTSPILAAIVILAFLGLTNLFLYTQFGPLAIYFRLGTYIVLGAAAVVMLVFGILNIKVGAIVAGVIIAAVFMKFDGPDVLADIAADLKEGPVTMHTTAGLKQTVITSRTRRGTTHRTEYAMEFSDGHLGSIEITKAYYNHYESPNNVFSGTITYYENSGILIGVISVDD